MNKNIVYISTLITAFLLTHRLCNAILDCPNIPAYCSYTKVVNDGLIKDYKETAPVVNTWTSGKFLDATCYPKNKRSFDQALKACNNIELGAEGGYIQTPDHLGVAGQRYGFNSLGQCTNSVTQDAPLACGIPD